MKVAINMEPDFIENFDIYDALCIDDVHLVHNHPKWQEMIFYLINQSKENKCNLYFGTEESILELDLLPDLSSRLSRMQSLQILSVPNDMLKEALTFCADKLEIPLDHEVVDYLLKREKREFQHLFSLLKHLDQASAQQKRKITIPFAKQILLS
jgi:DnaA family protein